MLVAALALFRLGAARAQSVIRVPADQPTIQAAINLAAPGATVLVAPGTYNENLNFMGKAITVTSSGGAQVTIIDGGALNSVVMFKTSETPTSVLNGFTITNGFSSNGGGIWISGSSPTITNNIVSNNKACEGAGIDVQFGGPLIRGNDISNNVLSGCGGVGGGGIELIGASTGAQIIGNAITGNNGGGIGMWTPGPALIQGNIISGNTAGGIGGVNDTSAVRIIQNVITGNTAFTGGGLEIDNSVALVLNNTIAGNNAQGDGSAFFGAFFTVTGPMTVTNNLIIGDASHSALGCRFFDTVSPPVFSFNDVFSPAGSAYGAGCVSQTGTNGNISADPLFVDTLSSNYHLRVGSPAIDVGDNNVPGLPPKDIDGDNRIINATGLQTAIIDIGADEFSNSQVLTLSSSALVFGTEPIFTTSAAQSVTFTNHGPTAVNISGVISAGDFSQSNNCGASLATGASCIVTVTFTPTVRGPRNGVLAIMTDASESPQAVILSGTATGPAVSLSTTSLFFNPQVLNTTSPAQQVTVTNTGDGPLTFISIAASGDFAVISTGIACSTGTPVVAGGNCSLSITFTPTATGTRNGQVAISDNASGSPQVIQLSGQGLSAGVVSLSPASLTFSTQLVGTTSAAQMLTLTNTGSGTLTISGISVSGDFAAPNNCHVSPATLAAGAACTFSVTFTPRLPNIEGGSIIITSDAPASPSMVQLNGTGVGSALSLSASRLSFATQTVGSTSAVQAITATNSTATAISITSIVASGDFAQTNNCGTTIAAAGVCTIGVTFTPTATETRTGNVTLTFNSLGSPQTTSLNGTGISQAAGQLFWKLKTAFNDPRTSTGVEGAAASLISGKLYVSHGYRGTDTAFLSIYDLATDSWTHGGPTAPNASVARSEMAGGSAFGNHFAIGGRTGPTAANEQFDPSTTTWTSKAPMSMARGGLGAASFNNKIYAIGGRLGPTYGVPPILNVVEVYDPAADAWARLAPLPVAVSDDYATLALNGKIYVFGGTTNVGPGTTNLVQIYDIASNTWSAGAPMPTARGAAMAGVIGSRIAVFGGVDATLTDLSITELYDPTANSWERGPDMISTVSEIAQGVTSDGTQVFAVGSGIFGVSGATVQALLLRDFLMAPASGSSASATAVAGQSATYTLSLAGTNGFTGNVTVTCTNAPANSTCTASPSSVTVGPTASNFTVTVATTARSMAIRPDFWPPARNTRPDAPLFMWLCGLTTLAYLVLLRGQRARLAIGILMFLVLSWAGCAGGGHGSTVSQSPSGTPPGTYALTVTASSGMVSHSTTLTLIVQ